MQTDWLTARVRATPRATAVLIGDQQWSYADLDRLTTAVAARLEPHVVPGARVAALLPNGLLYVCLIHALGRLGAVLVPLNTRLTRTELEQQIEQARCALLVTDKEGGAHGSLAVQVLILPDVPGLAQEAHGAPVLLRPFDPAQAQAIVFTSGTTGRPKGAILTFANHQASATASAFRLGILPGDRWLSCLPLYHVGGLAIILRSCLYGTAVVLHDRFEEAAISHSLDMQAITLISLVPTMVRRLLAWRDGRPWPSSLRHVLVGGAAAPLDLVQTCLDQGIPITTTYGLTEAASQVATLTTPALREKPGAVGRPLMFNSVAICDEQGRALPAGKEGEIVVSGPIVMAGYDGDAEATAAALRDGRLFTGDVGYLDDDGDLWLLQRRSDIVVSGGENVYPVEVEAVLQAHPAVTTACVVGVPDTEWGQRVAAALVLAAGAPDVDEAALLAYCRQHLAGYKLPRQIVFLPELPLTASGKIARQALIDLLGEG